MTYLLIWNKFERINLIKNIILQYINNRFNIDELHLLLDLIINDTLRLDKDLFGEDFYILCENFKDNFLDFYNDLPANEIDINPSNYVLKDEFEKWAREFYKQLLAMLKIQ